MAEPEIGIEVFVRFVGRTLHPDAASASELDRVANVLPPLPYGEVYVTGLYGGNGDTKVLEELALLRAHAVGADLAARGVRAPIDVKVHRDPEGAAPAPFVQILAKIQCEGPPVPGDRGER